MSYEMGNKRSVDEDDNNNNAYNYKNHDPWTRNGEYVKVNGADKELGFDRENSITPLTGMKQQRKVSVYHHDPSIGTAGSLISIFNLMNAILGSGILGLPYAMAQLGIVLFFVCAVIVAFLALYAIFLLLKLCDMTGVKAYEKLGFHAFGLPGRIVTAVCILMQNIGAMSSYLFIVKYELPNVLMTLLGVDQSSGEWYLNGDYLVILVTVCIVVPLASLKNIGFLGYTSGFSISCMFFFTAVVIYKKFVIECPLFDSDVLNHNVTSLTDNYTEIVDIVTHNITSPIKTSIHDDAHIPSITDDHHGENISVQLTPEQKLGLEFYHEFGPQECEPKISSLSSKWAYSIPTMMFSFVCHTAVLPIYAELKNPTPKRMQKVSNTSISICFILYSLSAVFGYLTFYNWMEPELLMMYSLSNTNDLMTLIVRCCVLIAVILTIPLTHFPARKALTFLLFPEKEFSWFSHLGLMTFLLTFINILVIFVPSIREVFGIIGATASTMLVFILPSLFYLRIAKEPISTSRMKKGAIALAALGFIVMIESLAIIIIGYFD